MPRVWPWSRALNAISTLRSPFLAPVLLQSSVSGRAGCLFLLLVNFMDSDAVIDASVGESRRSSPFASSDSDAVNTSTARVYFGPIQSAEKKRVRMSNTGQGTPVRRSTRISTAAALQAGEDGHLSITTVGIEPDPEGEQSGQSSGRETPVSGEDMLEGAHRYCSDM